MTYFIKQNAKKLKSCINVPNFTKIAWENGKIKEFKFHTHTLDPDY